MNKFDMNSCIKLKAVLQRTKSAEVMIHHQSQGKLDLGFIIFLGIGFDNIAKLEKETIYSLDSLNLRKQVSAKVDKLIDKILSLRVFPDDSGKMNLNIEDVSGGIYIVSQFTLFADCTKGNRPGFSDALKPDFAHDLYDYFIEKIKAKVKNLVVYTGEFGADMQVNLCNDGPVTLILEY